MSLRARCPPPLCSRPIARTHDHGVGAVRSRCVRTFHYCAHRIPACHAATHASPRNALDVPIRVPSSRYAVQHNHDTRGDTRRGCVNAPGRGVIVGSSCPASLALRTILHRDAAQWTLLHFTMYFGCLDAAGLLLDAGADPSIRNNVRRMRWPGRVSGRRACCAAHVYVRCP